VGLTGPESFVDWRDRKRALARAKSVGWCAACRWHDPEVMAWGRSVCKIDFDRKFPRCQSDGRGPGFELEGVDDAG
jgi:hypothetical protein